ncbi:MAG: hypothetical protein HRU41_31905 [Saprospiraceae bacterium]|nr:hypothetical protein [Saprospiraceae bacterium]
MKPKLCYTIWFSQRNGSSLFCEGLKSTGLAGKPEEYFNFQDPENLLFHYKVNDYESFRKELWRQGSTPNGIFGVKVNAPRREDDPLLEQLRKVPGLKDPATANHFDIWQNVMPNQKHIFLTRRNKIQQAVSWWKAIVSKTWHWPQGVDRNYRPADIRERYDFAAIRHLLLETSLREAKIQDMLNQAGATALTIVYEDFIQSYEETIRTAVKYLGVETEDFPVAAPYYQQLADDLSDEWTERFRKELQQDWKVVIW